jgi:hypothetical protein
MLMPKAIGRFKTAVAENRRSLIWLFVTYIPAVFVAGYGGYWLFHTYAFAFIVGGGYMVWLIISWARILQAIRDQ